MYPLDNWQNMHLPFFSEGVDTLLGLKLQLLPANQATLIILHQQGKRVDDRIPGLHVDTHLWIPVALSWPGSVISLVMDDEWMLREKNVAAAFVAC